ncbi:MAG: glycosyltransferase [Terriglobales bacterium]
MPARRIEVLPHFQALPAEEQLTSDEGYLLYFGRLSPEKGVYELLRSMVQLPHIPLVIAGDGPERPRLEALARELNLKHILFAGMVHGEPTPGTHLRLHLLHFSIARLRDLG